MSESEIARQINEWFRKSSEHIAPWREQALEDYKFYLGDQWKNEDRAKLREEGRPDLTINKIRPVVNVVMGYERQSLTDITYLPIEHSDYSVTQVLNQLVKLILSSGAGEHSQSYQFQDGLICGQGWGQVILDHNQNPHDPLGDIKYRKVDPFSIYLDPYSLEPDLSDARFVIRAFKMPLDIIKKIYPHRKEAIGDAMAVSKEQLEENVHVKGYPNHHYDHGGDTLTLEEMRDDRPLVLECWYREYQNQRYIFDEDAYQFYPTELPSERLSALLERAPQLRVITKMVPKMRYAVVLGSVMLEGGPSPYRANMFPLIPFYASFVGSAKSAELRYQGLVRALKDPQREINKRRAQLLHIINTAANSGWIGDKGATDKKTIEQFGNKPGVYIEVSPGKRLERIAPAPWPQGYTELELISTENIKEISGVNADLLGQYEKTTPGVAIQMRQRQGITVMQEMFDNFRLTKQLLGKVLLHAVQAFYTPEKILRAVGTTNKQMVKLIGGEMETAMEVLMNRDISRFDVVVSENQNTPSWRRAAFQELLQLTQLGAPIPMDILVEASDVPRKEEILGRLRSDPAGPEIVPQTGGSETTASSAAAAKMREAAQRLADMKAVNP